MNQRPGTIESLRRAMMSWRMASVSLLSFSSGLPLGLIWIAIPDWMRSAGMDIRVVGLITLAQAPWTFKMLWSPLLDRYRLPFGGRRRGWAIVFQVMLFACTLGLAGVGNNPEAPWVVAALAFAIAFAAASQDIVIDAYAVDVLHDHKEEQGVVVGARLGIYRAAMYVAGALAITLAGVFSWVWVNVLLACLYLPMMIITWKAPEPESSAREPGSLREAVWQPFLGFLGRHRALEILAFVFLYKFSDNLAQGLLRPFLVDKGYTAIDRGVALGTVGFLTIIAGAFIGGLFTSRIGLGHALWLFGLLQIFSNIGYVFVDRSEVNRVLMYSAMSFENFSQGLGTGAFSVLLLRMTQQRFSATQYALFSSLFSLPRIVAGPIAGFMVDAMGWEAFFWMTLLAGIPGLVILQRFVPLGVREPVFSVEPPHNRAPLSTAALWVRGLAGGGIGFACGVVVSAGLALLKAARATAGQAVEPAQALAGILLPADTSGWMTLAGLLILGSVCGLMTAAVTAARHGSGLDLGEL
jgi:PAT family beta-lactamase induction signal transducer AmpG